MSLSDYTANNPDSPFRDPVAGETGYIDPVTMREFTQTIIDEMTGMIQASIDNQASVDTAQQDDINALNAKLVDLQNEVDELAQSMGNRFRTVRTYSTNISEPPSNGQLRFNVADQTATTLMWMDNDNDNGTDETAIIQLLDPTGMTLYVQDRNNSDNWQEYTIASKTDKGEYHEFEINWVKGGTALPNGSVAMGFIENV